MRGVGRWGVSTEHESGIMQMKSNTGVSDVATGDCAMLGANDPPSPVLSQPRTTKRARDIQEDELHQMMDVACKISDDDDVGPRPTWTAATDLLWTEVAVVFHEPTHTSSFSRSGCVPTLLCGVRKLQPISTCKNCCGR